MIALGDDAPNLAQTDHKIMSMLEQLDDQSNDRLGLKEANLGKIASLVERQYGLVVGMRRQILDDDSY